MAGTVLTHSLQRKLNEAIERTEHLISLVPLDKLHWHPETQENNFGQFGDLLGHLLDCMGGFCAVMLRAFPEELAQFAILRSNIVNHFAAPEEALSRFQAYRKCIDAGFLLCQDPDWERLLPSVFVPEGLPMLTLYLNNLEHLVSHKYQLFFYLKLLGVKVGTQDIYHFHKT